MSRRLGGRAKTALAAGSAAVLVFLAYYEVLTYWFTGTDTIPLIETSRVSTLGGVLETFAGPLMEGSAFTERALFYRPIASLSYAIDYRLWGLDPFGYHLTDLIAHATAAALVVLLVQTILDDRVTAAIAGWVFALHPLSVEVVPTPARRHDVLATVFALAALYLFVRALKGVSWAAETDAAGADGGPNRKRSSGRRWLLVGGSVLSYLLAIGSKEIGALVPVLIGVWFLLVAYARRPPLRSAIRSGVVLLLPYAIATAGYLALRVLVLGGLGGYDRPPWDSGGEALAITVSRYVLSLVYPVDFVGALSGFSPQLIPNGLYVVLAGVSILAAHNASRTPSKTAVLASASGRLLALAGVWLVIPIALFARTARYTLRSGYVSIVPLAVVLAVLFVTAARNLATRRHAGDRREATGDRGAPSGRSDDGIEAVRRLKPRSGPGFATLAVAVVLIASLVAGSALVNPYGEWERAGDLSKETLEGVSANVATTPANATVDVGPIPHPRSARRMGSFPHARSVTFVWGNTVASWLELQGYAGKRDIRINETTVLEEMPERTTATVEEVDGRFLVWLRYVEDCSSPSGADSASSDEPFRNHTSVRSTSTAEACAKGAKGTTKRLAATIGPESSAGSVELRHR